MVDAGTAASILKTQGPMALALVVVVIILAAESTAFIAFIRYISKHLAESVVPVRVYDDTCTAIKSGIDEIKTLIITRSAGK